MIVTNSVSKANIESRLAAAYKGNWVADKISERAGMEINVYEGDGEESPVVTIGRIYDEADAIFVANAKPDIEYLLSRVGALEAGLEKILNLRSWIETEAPPAEWISTLQGIVNDMKGIAKEALEGEVKP